MYKTQSLTASQDCCCDHRKENHTESAIYEGLKLKTLWFSFDMSLSINIQVLLDVKDKQIIQS